MSQQVGKKSIDDMLLGGKVAITNGKEPAMQRFLSQFGYDLNRLAEGDQHITALQHALNNQAARYGEQYGSTEQFHSAWRIAKKSYKVTLKIARIALSSDYDAHVALEMNGKRKEAFAGWYQQAMKFYDGITDRHLGKLAKFGFTRDKIEHEKALVEATLSASIQQAKEIGVAQASTKKRDAVLERTAEWLHTYYQIARIAFEDQPQLVEVLGLKERS